MSVTILIIAFVTWAVGISLIKHGRWGRRVGNVPHCRKCDYVLTGNVTGTCPECGSLLAKDAIVYGRHPHRPAWVWTGVLLLLCGSLLLLPGIGTSVMQFDWYRYRSTDRVIADLDSQTPGRPDRAWNELKRRIDKGALKPAQEHALIARALREQQSLAATFEGSNGLIEYLGEQYAANRLDDAESRLFLDNEMKIRLDVRPVVGPADRIAYRFSGFGRGPSRSWMITSKPAFWIDDKTVTGFLEYPLQNHLNGWTVDGTLPPQPIGKHRLRVDFVLSVRQDRGPSPIVQSRPMTLSGEFTVEAEAPKIAAITSPDATTIGACIKLRNYEYDEPHEVHAVIGAENLPVPVAFHVFARVHGKEYPMGQVHFDAGDNPSYGFGADRLPAGDIGPVDIILRSSDDVARGTPDMTRIWQGEVIIPDIKFEGRRGRS